MASIAGGVSQTVTDAEEEHSDCPGERFILLGYSQGAMVMHRAELTLKARDRAAYNLIVGTVLVADGDRLSTIKARQCATPAWVHS